MAPTHYEGPFYTSYGEKPAVIRHGTEAHAMAVNFLRTTLGLPPDDLSVMFARHADRMKAITNNAIRELHAKHSSGAPSPCHYSNDVSAQEMNMFLQQPDALPQFERSIPGFQLIRLMSSLLGRTLSHS